MKFNNDIISKNKKIGFLICKKKKIRFYKKFNWKNLSKRKYKLSEMNSLQYGMVFNEKSKKKFYDFSQ